MSRPTRACELKLITKATIAWTAAVTPYTGV